MKQEGVLAGVVFAMCLSSLPADAGEVSRGLVERFPIPSNPIEIERAAKPGRFFDTMARRAGILGTEGEGFEAWVYPLKLLHDCRIRVSVSGADESVELENRVDYVTVRPESVTLTATHSLFTIRETFFTPLDLPGTIILLDIDTSKPLTLSVSFVPDLKPMWPAGLGGQYASWNQEQRLCVISESRRKYNGLIGCPAATRGSRTPAHELGKEAVRFDIEVDPATARRYFYPVVIAGSQTGREAAYEAYDAILGSIPEEYRKRAQHFRDIRKNLLSIETPEPELNLAFEWAKVALDKGLVNNPDLGTGLVAGWGTSGDSARPGFGWFFGGDTFLNEFAISGIGDFPTMNRAFRFLQQRQRADGKMMHELTQSAAWLKWFEEYPYGYYHGDTTPFYITAFYDYYLQSGDAELLKSSWDSLKQAFAYCRSTDEDGDGLMDNTRAGLGASELGSLLEGLRTDVLLGALSPAAWRAMAAMAEVVGDTRTLQEARTLEEKAATSADEEFWNPELGSIIHALTKSGKQNRELTAWPALGIMLGVFRGEHADRTAEMLASAALSADWGARMLANTSKAYDPAAYNNGAVWPFLTGLVSAAEFERHRAQSGYRLALANARLTWAGALGCHPELLSGDYYRVLETAVPHQLFSSGGVITPVVRGLLGLSGDAMRKIVGFKPHLPASWTWLRIHNYRVGKDLFDIALDRTSDRWSCTIQGGGGYQINLSPAFGLLTRVKSADVSGADRMSFGLEHDSANSQDVHYLVSARSRNETTAKVDLLYEAGVELQPSIDVPKPGAVSHDLRILGMRNDGARVTALIEGLSGRNYVVRVYTSLPIRTVRGGNLRPSDQESIEVSYPPADPPRWIRSTLEIDLQPKQ